MRTGFPKCGACELIFASEKGGLWTENFEIWGLVNWKFPNLGACELKISKFGGLWAKIWVKIEAVEAKISKFSQKGSCELTLLLEMGPLRTTGEAWKGGLQFRAAHPHTPFLGQCPPPPRGGGGRVPQRLLIGKFLLTYREKRGKEERENGAEKKELWKREGGKLPNWKEGKLQNEWVYNYIPCPWSLPRNPWKSRKRHVWYV